MLFLFFFSLILSVLFMYFLSFILFFCYFVVFLLLLFCCLLACARASLSAAAESEDWLTRPRTFAIAQFALFCVSDCV